MVIFIKNFAGGFKMNKTTELTFITIGLVLQFLVLVAGVTTLLLVTNLSDLNSSNLITIYAWFVMVVHLVGFVVGVFTLVNKNESLGRLLFWTGIIMLPLTLLATFIQSSLFIASGLSRMNRKKKILASH